MVKLLVFCGLTPADYRSLTLYEHTALIKAFNAEMKARKKNRK